MKRTTILMMIVTTLTLFSCMDKGNKAALTANEWQLKEMTMAGEKVALPQRVPTFVLTDTNTLYGFSGCNRFFGKYSVEGNTIKLEPGGSTMMACPDMQFESQYMKVLSEMTTYSVENKELKLTDKDGKQILIYVPKMEEEQLIGVSEDPHGCNAAAGFTWSEAKNDCIRLFESGIRLNSAQDTAATTSAFIVFTADSAQVEVFIPNEEVHPLLDKRTLPAGGFAWNIEDDDTYNVRQVNGKWIIEKRAVILYSETPVTNTKVTFQGGDGKTKMLYQIEVTFFPEQGIAVVNYDGQTYELQQEVMASGYQYKNDQVLLTGKGNEAKLTLPDGKVLTLKEKK